MITLQIDNSEVENIFVEGFQSNKEKFLAFIQNAYNQKALLEAYEADKKRSPRSHVARGNAYSTPNYQKRSTSNNPSIPS